LHELFTSYKSEFGGPQIEGSVLYDGTNYYKFVMSDQYSKELRKDTKKSFEGSDDEKANYYSKLEEKAKDIFESLDKSSSLEDALKELSDTRG
jgi:hypothetical protein